MQNKLDSVFEGAEKFILHKLDPTTSLNTWQAKNYSCLTHIVKSFEFSMNINKPQSSRKMLRSKE